MNNCFEFLSIYIKVFELQIQICPILNTIFHILLIKVFKFVYSNRYYETYLRVVSFEDKKLIEFCHYQKWAN